MKLGHRIKLFIARKTGKVSQVKKMESIELPPMNSKPSIEKSYQEIPDVFVDLLKLIDTKKLFLENLVEKEQSKTPIDYTKLKELDKLYEKLLKIEKELKHG